MGWTRQEVLDVARSTGMPVVEAWSSHNAGQMGTVLGPMLHHTGSTWAYPASKAPTLRTVREGRSDLQNALCMYYIDYEGVIYCITEKIAWHAGAGSWQGVTDGNGHYAGIEAESDGKQWTKPTVASYKHLAAAILRKTGRTVAYAPLHKQYALPPGRKTDFSGMDPATFLADVNADLSGNPTSEDDDMAGEGPTILGHVEEIRRMCAVALGAMPAATPGEGVTLSRIADTAANAAEARRMLAVLLGVSAPAGSEKVPAGGGSALAALTQADLAAIAAAVNDELARRQAS